MLKISSHLFFAASTFVCVIFLSGMCYVHDPNSVQIEKDAVIVNGTMVSKDWKVSTLQALIGKPDKVDGDEHPEARYDQFDDGIRYWQRNCHEMGDYVEEFYLYISSEDDATTDRHSAFNGIITLNGTVIDSNTTLDNFRKIAAGWQPCNAYSDDTFEFMTDTNFFYIEYDPSHKKLKWICVGKRTSIISGCD